MRGESLARHPKVRGQSVKQAFSSSPQKLFSTSKSKDVLHMMPDEESESSSPDQSGPDARTWVERFGNELYAYALTRLRDSHASEEVVQETLLAGVKYLHQFRGESSEKSWLMSILRRKIVDYVRGRNRHDRRNAVLQHDGTIDALLSDLGSFDPDLIPEDMDPGRLATDKELWELVRECLELLPQRQADAFMLREFEGLSAEDICETLKISRSNLWVLLHRARLRIAECLFELWRKGDTRKQQKNEG